jgi:hypothetical protein
VSDIFREVDEEVRRERLQRLWERYQTLIIAAIVLLLVGIGGWRAYEWWDAKQSSAFGDAFEAAVALSDQGKSAEAEAAFGKIAQEGTRGYRPLARMRQAAELAKHDAKAAIAAYQAIAADTTVGIDMRDLAGLRAGALLVDNGSFAEVQAQLEPLTGDKRPYLHTARELLALAAWRAGDAATARKWLDLMAMDIQTPLAARQRMEILSALIASQGQGEAHKG